MKIVCIHFKGGVGKSTTAVHVVGILSELIGRKTLLVDGDRQVTSYSFFNNGIRPQSDDETPVNPEISLFPLQTLQPSTGLEMGKRLRKIGKIKCDHLVIDTTPDPATTNLILTEVEPDLVLIPVKFDDQGSHSQLTPLLETIARMSAIGIRPKVKLIPLGGGPDNISPYADNTGQAYFVTQPIPLLPKEFGDAVYKKFCYVWELHGCEKIYDIYRDIVWE
ncbi:ParA family protein [Pseudomonas cedrina subsp. fulgida]|nr:ParA family protein [Pseudomonas cedrina subsp. fulgida]